MRRRWRWQRGATIWSGTSPWLWISSRCGRYSIVLYCIVLYCTIEVQVQVQMSNRFDINFIVFKLIISRIGEEKWLDLQHNPHTNLQSRTVSLVVAHYVCTVMSCNLHMPAYFDVCCGSILDSQLTYHYCCLPSLLLPAHQGQLKSSIKCLHKGCGMTKTKFEAFMWVETDRQRQTDRDRQTDRQAGRQTDRQTDWLTDRHTDRQTDGQTDRHTDRDTWGNGAGFPQGLGWFLKKTPRQDPLARPNVKTYKTLVYVVVGGISFSNNLYNKKDWSQSDKLEKATPRWIRTIII